MAVLGHHHRHRVMVGCGRLARPHGGDQGVAAGAADFLVVAVVVELNHRRGAAAAQALHLLHAEQPVPRDFAGLHVQRFDEVIPQLVAAGQGAHQGGADLKVVFAGGQGVIGGIKTHDGADFGGGGADQGRDLFHSGLVDEALGVLDFAQQRHQGRASALRRVGVAAEDVGHQFGFIGEVADVNVTAVKLGHVILSRSARWPVPARPSARRCIRPAAAASSAGPGGGRRARGCVAKNEPGGSRTGPQRPGSR